MARYNEGKDKNNRLVRRVKLPPRPKRAMNPYTSFIKDYWMKNRSKLGEKKKKRPTIKTALAEWRRLDSIKRKTYEIQSIRDHDRFNNEMKVWMGQKELLKIPANSFALFVQEKWAAAKNNKRGRRKSFGEMSKSIAKEWHKISDTSFQGYVDRAKNNYRQHLERLEDMKTGSLLDDDIEDFVDECFDPSSLSDLEDDSSKQEISPAKETCKQIAIKDAEVNHEFEMDDDSETDFYE